MLSQKRREVFCDRGIGGVRQSKFLKARLTTLGPIVKLNLRQEAVNKNSEHIVSSQLALSLPAAAAEPDVAGAKDHPLLRSYDWPVLDLDA